MKPTIAIYPGTFDPVTLGHVDMIKRATKLCDTLIVAVAEHSNKMMMFDVSQRIEMIETIIQYDQLTHIKVLPIKGLTVDFAVEHDASLLIRGLRTLSDFDYEFQMVGANRMLNPEIDTIFLPADPHSHFLSSSIVKQIHKAGGDVSRLIHQTTLAYF